MKTILKVKEWLINKDAQFKVLGRFGDGQIGMVERFDGLRFIAGKTIEGSELIISHFHENLQMVTLVHKQPKARSIDWTVPINSLSPKWQHQ